MTLLYPIIGQARILYTFTMISECCQAAARRKWSGRNNYCALSSPAGLCKVVADGPPMNDVLSSYSESNKQLQ